MAGVDGYVIVFCYIYQCLMGETGLTQFLPGNTL